jgi:hypothetical protein
VDEQIPERNTRTNQKRLETHSPVIFTNAIKKLQLEKPKLVGNAYVYGVYILVFPFSLPTIEHALADFIPLVDFIRILHHGR